MGFPVLLKATQSFDMSGHAGANTVRARRAAGASRSRPGLAG